MDIAILSHVGAVRKNNEDAALYREEEGIFLVADGMGGYTAGEIAAAMAAQTVLTSLLEAEGEEPEEALREAFYKANNMVFEKSRAISEYQGMGTTLTLAWLKKAESQLYLAHVGDSRAYLVREGHISQLSQDHTLVADMVKKGELKAEQVKNHPQRHILTRALGNDPWLEVDIRKYDWQKGDSLLLCTDGLTNLVTDEELLQVILAAENAKTATEKLLTMALKRGG